MIPIPTTAREELERYIKDDLEHATVSSAMVLVEEGGRITINELVLRLEDGRIVSPSLPDAEVGTAADMRLEAYDDRHGWREATVLVDYAEELDDLTQVWCPEPDTLEEARL